jgi:hypothetical protein
MYEYAASDWYEWRATHLESIGRDMSRDAVCRIFTFLKHFHKRATADIFFFKNQGNFYVLACFILFMTGARAFTRQKCRFKGLGSREKADHFSQPDAPQP